VLVASGILEDLYSLALYQLNKKGIAISVESAETALIRGQFAILKDSL
jgi:hypothetical protein